MMHADDNDASTNDNCYQSLMLPTTSVSPRLDPSQSTDYPSINFSLDGSMTQTLISKNNGKASLKPFIITAIIICVIIVGVIGFMHIHNYDKYGTSSSFLDQDANSNPSCNSDINCNGHGTCNYYTTGCKCDIGYTTHNSKDGTECNYKQKYQMNAFLLSLFLGEFGAGRYYVGDYLLGTIKLCLIFTGCCIACCSIMGSFAADNGTLLMVGYCILCCSAFGLGIWCIVDIILFAINDIPDQNGVELAPW